MTTILVVDDSLTERLLASSLLKQALDCSTTEVDSAEAALEYLANAEPDIVLTDLHMPGLNGLQLVERIREMSSLPVILMTAKGSEDIAAQALKVGAAGYVPKKCLAQDLIPTVQRILTAADHDRRHSRLMHNLTTGSLTFDIRNDLSLIAPLIRLIQEMLRSLPLGDEAERLRVSVAVEEAIKNAIYHGSLEVGTADATRPLDDLLAERLWAPPYCNRNVKVTATVSHDEAVFTIQDEGPGFDVASIEGEDFDGDAHGSRGIRLMRTFMDDVQFSDNGRNVVLRKRRFEEPDFPDDAD